MKQTVNWADWQLGGLPVLCSQTYVKFETYNNHSLPIAEASKFLTCREFFLQVLPLHLPLSISSTAVLLKL